jgi:hypothetical protein
MFIAHLNFTLLAACLQIPASAANFHEHVLKSKILLREGRQKFTQKLPKLIKVKIF